MPVIVEPRYDVADLETDLLRVYEDFPGRTAPECLDAIRTALRSGGVFYTGTFNGKQVAGALVSGPADARQVSLVAVRAATRRRGVAVRLVDEVARLEQLTGARELLIEADGDAERVLMRSGFARTTAGPLRKPLSAG